MVQKKSRMQLWTAKVHSCQWVKRTGKYLQEIAEGEHVQNVAEAIFEKIHGQDMIPVSQFPNL